MSTYESLAAAYDRLTYDIPYGDILKFAQKRLAERGLSPRSVLDLACGTGSLSILLAKAGYSVIGLDLSEEMLMEATDKAWELEENRPFFVQESMAQLELPEPVDFTVCCLDSINYLTDPQDCRETFKRVHENLVPGGAFLFDINTEEKLRSMDGQVFLDEDEEVFCVWRGSFDENERICTYGMDIFQKQGRLWDRTQEEHREYAYTREQLLGYLREAGFQKIDCYGDLREEAPGPHEQRIYFMAVKEG